MQMLWKKIVETTITRLLTIAKNATLKVTGAIMADPLAIGSARTLTTKEAGHTFKLDTAAGSTATLPAATGSGARFRFVVSVLATSNSHIVKVANANDTMSGIISSLPDAAGAVIAWPTVAASDTITLNRTTTGSTQLGEYIEVEDIAANKWAVRGMTASTATEATPFSAAV